MLNQVSHAQAMNLLLNGYSITETAEMLGVSRTTIYNRRKDFLDYAEKEGVLMAAEHFDVEDTFEELFNLARELKQYELKVEEARRGSAIVALLDSIKVGDPQNFIKEVIQESQESGISGDEITKYAVELQRLQEKEGKSYSQLISEINDRVEEHRDVGYNLKLLEEQKDQVEEDLERVLEESETTKNQLKTFVGIRESLEDNDVNLADMEKLENIIVNLREHNYDVNEIIDFYGEMKISKSNLERNRSENERLENHNKALLKENYSQEERLENNLAMVTAVKYLHEMEIDPDHIFEISKTISDMSNVLDLSKKEALDRFVQDVKSQYTERSGYMFQLKELQKLQDIYQEKNSMLKEQVDVLEEVLEDRRQAVESLKRLETLGINDGELVEWSNVVNDLEYDLSIFREAVARLGGIPEYVEKKTEEISSLEAKETILRANINDLEMQLDAMRDTLSILRSTIEYEMGKITEIVDSFENYFTSPVTGFKVRSTRIVDDIVENLTNILKSTEAEWKNDLEILDDSMTKIVEETSRVLENAYTGGRIVGRFHALEPIHKIMREEEVPKIEGTIGVITMLTYIKMWLVKNYSDEHVRTFDVVIERLMGELGDIYQR